MRLPACGAAPRPLVWLAALLGGSVLGLGARLASFIGAALLVRGIGVLIARLVPLLPSLDPVYTHAAGRSLADLHLQGVAVASPLGDWLHTVFPSLFVPAARSHWAYVRIAVEPGSPVLARLLASGLAHAAVLSAGLLIVRYGWRRRHIVLVLAGLAVQVQVAIGILGAPPSIRELEATGLSFAANALVPWLAPRGAALSDGAGQAWPPLLSAALVALALLVGYLPIGLVLLLRDRLRRITFGTAAFVMLGSAACAGVLGQDAAVAGQADIAPVGVAARVPPAPPLVVPSLATTPETGTIDRWFA
ncbi:MAG TPA: hypothetical protein VF937_11200, partial [Chloroflexota bacterium]